MKRSDSARRIMIAGGSGLIGRHLSAALLARGDEVLVLSPHPPSVRTRLPGCSVLRWHPGSDGRWQDELDAVDAVVDLSGAPFFHKVVQRSLQARGPRVFVSASSLGPYGFRRDDQVLTERSSPDIGPLSRGALELGAGALEAEALGTRVVLLRPSVARIGRELEPALA